MTPAKDIKSYPMTLKPKDVAEIMNVSLPTAYRYMKDEDFPSVKRPGRAPRVLRDVLYAWLLENSNIGA